MKKGIHIVYRKKYMSPYYFLFYIQLSSCRKREIQMICLKSPKSSDVALLFLTNSGKKSLTMLILSFFNNCSIDFFQNREIE